eukprot:4279491-Amphidinium_carterae.1
MNFEDADQDWKQGCQSLTLICMSKHGKTLGLAFAVLGHFRGQTEEHTFSDQSEEHTFSSEDNKAHKGIVRKGFFTKNRNSKYSKNA